MMYDVIDYVEVADGEWEVSFESGDGYMAGLTFKVAPNKRPKLIDVQYFDTDGNPCSLEDTDFDERKLKKDAEKEIVEFIEEMEEDE